MLIIKIIYTNYKRFKDREAKIKSHQLMLRTGMIKQSSSRNLFMVATWI